MPFAGSYLRNGKVSGMGDQAGLWSSSATSASRPHSRFLYLYDNTVFADLSMLRGNAQSVRCLLDSPLDDS